jgi:hypothetical protein
MSTPFLKIVLLGTGSYGRVWCKINWDGTRLSITGVEGPLRNGDCRGGCGQIVMSRPVVERTAKGWSQELIREFWDTWDRWHLNNMRAECEHQRERGETWKTHPSAECPDCGYRLGSAWLKEEMPASVIEFLKSLPDTDQKPAWI